MVHSGQFKWISKPNGNKFHVSISAEVACKIHLIAVEDGKLVVEVSSAALGSARWKAELRALTGVNEGWVTVRREWRARSPSLALCG